MTDPRPLRPGRLAAAVASIVFLTVVLGRSDLLRITLAPRLVYAWRWIGALIDSIPPLLVWVGLATLALFSLTAVLVQLLAQLLSARGAPPIAEALPGPVQRYARQLAELPRGPYFEAQLARSLADLAMQVVERGERSGYRELEQFLRDDPARLPPEALAFLRGALRQEQATAEERPVARRTREDADAQAAAIAATLTWLETRLAGEEAR